MVSKKILNNVYIIKDSYNNYSNLVIGDEKALLFDTGLGLDNLKKKVNEITDLPLLIINSHGHIDHIGGNFQFDQVYLHQNDLCILDNYNQSLIEGWLKAITGKNLSLEKTYKPDFNIRKLDFDNFDLGNIEGKIIQLKGHTKGSIGVFIPKLRLLLSGDALLPLMTLYFDNYAGIEDQRKTLEIVSELNFDYYLTGHSDRIFPKSFINRLTTCLKNSKGKTHQYYKFPKPPYSTGFKYIDSQEEETVGIIVAK